MRDYAKKIALVIAITFFLLSSCATDGNNRSSKDKANGFYSLGLAMLHDKDLKGAYTEFNKALDIEPSNVKYLNALGLVYIEIQNYDKATESFLKAVNIDKEFSEGYNNLGITYAKIKIWDKAIEAFQNALKNPFYQTPYIALSNIGLSYYRKGDHDKAIEYYNEAIIKSQEFSAPYYGIALCKNMQNKYDEAHESLVQAINLDSEFNGDIQKAIKLFNDKKRYAKDIDLQDYTDYIDILHY
ncbi:hypothetical protein MCHI_003222 [Candidatus Magnetoovum chiemensis]|nr:hypothetical protein MCHI_003222 [Candidatus Magnetoovum chiemensis]